MDVTNNLTEAQPLHGIGENVAADGLDNVLDKFWTIAFEACPFSRAYTLIGHAVGAKLVHAHAGLDITELSPGGEVNEEHPAR